MPILKHIPVNKWTDEEQEIAAILLTTQDIDKCKEKLKTLTYTDRYYLIEYNEIADYYLQIYTI